MSYHEPAAFKKNFRSLGEQAVSGLTLKPISPVSYQVAVHGGFAYDAYNARGMLNPWNVLRLIECSRAVGWWTPSQTESGQTFMDIDNLGRLLFTVAVSMKFHPEIYDTKLEKRPVTIDNEMAHLGRTSFKYKTGLEFPGHQKPLVEVENQFVFVDPDMRKPKAPDDWWKDKYGPLMAASEVPLRIPALQPPDDVEISEEQVRILPSDIDPYMHMSWAHYLKYCLDMYTLRHVQQHGFTGNGDPFRQVKLVEINYKGESSIGDVVTIRFWDCQKNEDVCNFLLLKNEQVICECKLEFFPLIMS